MMPSTTLPKERELAAYGSTCIALMVFFRFRWSYFTSLSEYSFVPSARLVSLGDIYDSQSHAASRCQKINWISWKLDYAIQLTTVGSSQCTSISAVVPPATLYTNRRNLMTHRASSILAQAVVPRKNGGLRHETEKWLGKR